LKLSVVFGAAALRVQIVRRLFPPKIAGDVSGKELSKGQH
jgi:hypothetical protein